MINLEHIVAGYGDKMVLHDIHLNINLSEITVIMGPNGCGKTTLLKTIMGLIKPISGTISFENKVITPSPNKWIEHGVFMIGQGQRVFPQMSVWDNIEVATHYWKDRSSFKQQLDEVLQYVPDLRDRLNDMAGNLSGGQQQMVALARGLINKPKLLLMDEPSIGLSPKLIHDTFEKVKDINKKSKTGFLIVEHNLKTLLPLTDNSVIIDAGHIAYTGPSDTKTLDKMITKIF